MIGKTISHYRILEKLGEGGMGVVYRAHDTALDRDVALKFLPHYLTSDANEKERFYHEARAAAALTHQNIAVVHEIGEHENQLFIAMEYVEGSTLKQLVESETLSMKKALDIAIQVCEGLAAAHEKGIVHRDIKSDNIIVTAKGQAKIMDFGLAKVKGASRLTKAGSTIGTAAYMSPEQAQGEEVDHRSDIFSFGVVLYEMLTGKLPFRGEHQAALIYSIVHEEPQPVARFNTQVTPEIERIVSKALAKDREERYQHVDDLLADVRHERKCIEHPSGERATATMLAAAAPARRWWRSRLIFGLAGVVLLAVLVVIFNPFKRESGRKEIAGTGEKSIAVLPFVDMSPQHDQDYFCDGMTEELINRLSNIQGLRVPARTSAFYFKGKTEDIREVGSKLNVQTVLEGSVRKAGDELRITAQLINVADGYHLWSETYDRKLDDVFAIQDEISAAIVNALKLKLTPQEQQRLSEHPIDNVKAYEGYLKANRQIWRYNEKSLDSAFVYLQAAIDIVGDNALLYSRMGWAFYQYANMGIKQEEYFKQAEEFGKKAVTLDPNLPEALDLIGWLLTYKDYPENWREAYGYWKKALEAHPNDVGILSSMVIMYSAIGKFSEASAILDRMAVIDPLNPPERRWGLVYMYSCQFGRVLEKFRPLYLADSTSEMATYLYSLALAYNGKREEALAAIDRMGVSSPSTVHILFCLLLKDGLLKNKDGALRLLTPDLRKTCWRDIEWSQYVASLLSLAGAHKEALDWLENSVHHGFINYPFLQCDPFLDNIRGEERFKKLMAWAKNEWEHFEVPE